MKIAETNLKFGGLRARSSTKRAIIHHTASGDVSAATIHGWHKNQGWAGIGYHFVVRANGAIERGRPEHTIGSHAGPGGNGDSIGIVLTGNFETGKPTAAQMDSLVWLLANYLFPKYGALKVIGHKDVMATACPGRNFPWTDLLKRLEGAQVQETKVKHKGKVLQAFIRDGKTYVELRQLAEALGFTVDYNPTTKQTEVK